ncbi:MAG: hypothetical protein AB7U98_10765 [Candidatus Nitrosocosmicus sp.]
MLNKGQKEIISHSVFNIPLCKYCHKRNLGNNKTTLRKYSTRVAIRSDLTNNCFICQNFFVETLPSIISQIREHLSDFKEQVPTIDIGTILPFQFYENEDYLRSMFQIRGNMNIKNQINSQIREKIRNTTSCRINHSNPEIRFDITIQNDRTFSIIPRREFYLLGRYRKLKRGISQKNRTKGNHLHLDLYNPKFQVDERSIESFVNKIINQNYKPNSFKISWTGGEDKNSLVMGRGRPFIVKASGCTTLIREKRVFIDDGMEIEFETIDSNDIENIHRYRQLVKVFVLLKGNQDNEQELNQRVKSLVGMVRFGTKKKTVTRNIYESRIIDKRGENMELLFNMDNGIPIKQFIGGNDPIEPALSEVLRLKCECINFDIIECMYSR